MGMSYDDLFTRHGDINLEIEQRALLVMLVMGCLHDDMAPDDLTAEAHQLSRELAYAGFERGGGLHVAEGDL